MRLEAKVGIFIFIGIVFLFFMTTQVNDLNVSSKKDFHINGIVSNIAGLEKNAKVKINGLDVGFVKDFELVDDKVKIMMVLKQKVSIPEDSTIMLVSTSMLSGKFVEISFGNSKNYLAEDDNLVNEKVYASFDKTSDSIEQAANEVKLFVSELRALLNSGAKDDLTASLANIKSFTERLDNILKDNEKPFAETIQNFNKMALEIQQAGQKFGSMGERLGSMGDKVGNMGDKFATSADTINGRLPHILDRFEQIEKSVDTILVENREPLKNTLTSANKFFSDGGDAFNKLDKYFDNASKSQIELSLRGEMMANDGYLKNYAGLTYYTNPTQFYSFELTSTNDYTMDDNKANVPEIHDKGKNYVSAQVGKRFGDVVTRGGLIESTGGFGIDYLLKNDKLKTSIEMYDFNAVNDVRGENPHTKFSLRYNILKHVDVYTGYDNFLNSESANVFAGVGIRFVDDDIKSLVGGMGGSLVK